MPGVGLWALAAPGLAQGQLQALPAPGGKSLGRKSSRRTQSGQSHQGGAKDGGGQSRGGEDLGSRPTALPDDAQEEVLGADIAVAQLGGGLLGQTQGGLRPGGKFNVAQGVSPSVFFGRQSSPAVFFHDGMNIPRFGENLTLQFAKAVV